MEIFRGPSDRELLGHEHQNINFASKSIKKVCKIASRPISSSARPNPFKGDFAETETGRHRNSLIAGLRVCGESAPGK
jgi:hypothetical protein